MLVRLGMACCLVLAAVGAPAVWAAEPRPNLYGCGITWGNWLGYSSAQAREWDRRSMDKIVQMGGTNCPANFAWIDIETTQGTFNWDYVDHQVDDALARGLAIFAYTGLTPDWALPAGKLAQYGSGCGYRFPPADQYIPQFQSFFTTLAARYRGKVKYYEFWNEPNGCSWINDGCSNGQMAYTYVPWLIRWYNAMKQGDPDCVLAVGGLDYNEGVTNGYQYIEDIYTNGGGNYFDAVAIHPYGSPLHWQAITDTYNVLVNHGQGYKKLWLNEYGWNTTDEAAKAANVTTVLNTLKQSQYDMVFMANYLVITDLPGTSDSGHDYGLCSRTLSTMTITPRQSWYGFQSVDKAWPIQINFSADVTHGAVPLGVQFTDLSWYPNATGRLWDFGDGQTSTLPSPQHSYAQNGTFTVTLTVSGPNGPFVATKIGYIVAGVVPPVPGVDNPSFEANGGSLTSWELRNNTQSPDSPPLPNGTYGVSTTDGTHFGGKITSWMTMDFYMGQVVGTSNWLPASVAANWTLNALAQLSSTDRGADRSTNVHQVWEIGWNNDGSEPTSVMSCDHYQTIASLDGTFNGNSKVFKSLAATGSVPGVVGLRGVALRVHFYNTYGYEWSHANIDAVSFTVTSATPPAIPGDFDRDGDVDASDLLHSLNCGSGPGVPQANQSCQDADLDHDGDVDGGDFGILQRCLSGTDKPGNPGCG